MTTTSKHRRKQKYPRKLLHHSNWTHHQNNTQTNNLNSTIALQYKLLIHCKLEKQDEDLVKKLQFPILQIHRRIIQICNLTFQLLQNKRSLQIINNYQFKYTSGHKKLLLKELKERATKRKTLTETIKIQEKGISTVLSNLEIEQKHLTNMLTTMKNNI